MTSWKTKDGTEIDYCDLSDQHLRNILAMLTRNVELYCMLIINKLSADALGCDMYAANAPDGAAMAAESECRRLMLKAFDVRRASDEEILAVIPHYKALYEENMRRKRATV